MNVEADFALQPEDVEQLIHDNMLLEEENIALRTNYEQLQCDVSSLTEQNTDLESKLDDDELKMRDATSKLMKQQDKIALLESELRELKAAPDRDLNQAILQMKNELDQATNLDVTTKVQTLTNQLADAKQFNQQAEQLIQNVRKDLADQLSLSQQLKQQNFVEEVKLEQNRLLIEELQAENGELQKRLLEANQMQKSVSESTESAPEQQYQPIQRVVEKLSSAEEKYFHVAEQNNKLRAENSELALQRMQIAAKRDELEKTLASYEAKKALELQEVQQKNDYCIKELNFEAEKVKSLYEQEKQRLAAIQQDNEHLQLQLKQFNDEYASRMLQAREQQLKEAQQIQQENVELQRDNRQLQQDLDFSQRDNAESRAKIEKLKKKAQSMKAQMAQAQSTVRQLKAIVCGGYGAKSDCFGTIGEIERQIRDFEGASDDLPAK